MNKSADERKLGTSRTDEERLARHKELYGKEKLPLRGTGLSKTIVKVGDEYQLRSKHTGKVLGTHPSREAAMKQEAAIKISQGKSMEKGGSGSGRKKSEGSHFSGLQRPPKPWWERAGRGKESSMATYRRTHGNKPQNKSLDSLNEFLEKAAIQNVFAIATDKAKEMGYDDFSEGSEGRKKRDEIAETLKTKKSFEKGGPGSGPKTGHKSVWDRMTPRQKQRAQHDPKFTPQALARTQERARWGTRVPPGGYKYKSLDSLTKWLNK